MTIGRETKAFVIFPVGRQPIRPGIRYWCRQRVSIPARSCRRSAKEASVGKISRLAVLVAVSLLSSACAVAPGEPYYDAPVGVAPPPARVEYPAYPPAADYLWVSGYWNWGGGRYVWVPGRWESPRPGYSWQPHRWERDGDRWRAAGGRWERDARPRPAPMAVSRSGAWPVPEREARRSSEHAPAYRQPHGNAPRADSTERWRRERSDAYRADRR